MSAINQLLAKAMSTTSEEEAMSCLRMARKKGKSFDTAQSSSAAMYKGQNAEYWYDKAYKWYHEAKKRETDLTRDQQMHLFKMYKHAEEEYTRVRRENTKLQDELYRLKNMTRKHRWKLPVIGFQLGAIIVLAYKLIS